MKGAVIVGASSGIGRALAVALSLDGYRVGVVARRTDLLAQLREDGGEWELRCCVARTLGGASPGSSASFEIDAFDKDGRPRISSIVRRQAYRTPDRETRGRLSAVDSPSPRRGGASRTRREAIATVQTTRTFRIFVSSTFADLKEERNALQKNVFPRLKKLCRENGTRFQAIDLRWGVREEAGLDQQTMTICLDEIKRCRTTSPRPNFIVLLGDRYGWRPLPAAISEEEFEQIVNRVPVDDRALICEWYKRDDNAIPAVYSLQPRTGQFVDFATWECVESRVRAALTRAVQDIPLSDTDRLKYGASATEQEIAYGALRSLADLPEPREHVFCFCRAITNLPQDASATDFVDLDEHGRSDDSARARLSAVKDALRNLLADNTHEYEARWTGTGVTTDHLAQFCEDVWNDLSSVIVDEIARLKHVDPLEKEISDHQGFARERAEFFTGRAEILQTIGAYVRGSPKVPLAVAGLPGSGKSALMAKVADKIHADLPAVEVILRFIGATPGSSDIRTLLANLCREITRRYGADETTIPADYRELVEEFPKRLALAQANRPLVLVLDALDQLSDADHGRNLVWLPRELPDHVRFVVSTIPGECLSALKRKLAPANHVELEPMPIDEGGALLDLWLADAGRRLQPAQRAEVLEKFSRVGLPLYLKLAFEESRRWRSFSPATSLGADVPGIIRNLFRRLSLDANHGTMLVSRALAYLATAKNGLTEDELLDLLSSDEDVFRDFSLRARHEPPARQLPVVMWSRLYSDLEPYLSARTADGASLLTFYHRQLLEVTVADYLAGDDGRTRHAGLARYFSSQSLYEEAQKIPNLRKLSELPYQQTFAELWKELHETLVDFDFLEAKCVHVAVLEQGGGDRAKTLYGGVYELLDDYRQALDKFPERLHREDAVHIQRVLTQAARILARGPELLPQQLVGRITRSSQSCQSLVAIARLRGGTLLVPLSPSLAVRGSVIRQIARHQAEVVHLVLTGDGHIVTGGNDGRVYYTALAGGEPTLVAEHGGKVRHLVLSRDGQIVSCGDDGAVRRARIDDNDALELARHDGEVLQLALGDDGLVVTGGADGRVYCSRLEGGTPQVLVRHDGPVARLMLTGDGRVVTGGNDGRVYCVGLDGGEPVPLAQHVGAVSELLLTCDGRVVTGGADGLVCCVPLQGGEPATLVKHKGAVGRTLLIDDGHILTGGLDGAVYCAGLDGSEPLRVAQYESTSLRRVWHLAFSRDGRVVTAISTRVYCVPLHGGDSTLLAEHIGAVRQMDLTDDGRVVTCGLNDSRVFSTSLEGGEPITFAYHEGAVLQLKMTADGRLVTGGDDGRVYIVRLDGGDAIPLTQHEGAVTQLALTRDGSIVTGGKDGRVYYAGLDGDPVPAANYETGISRVLLIGEGRAVVGRGDGRVYRVGLESGELVPLLQHEDWISELMLTGDGRLLTAGGDGRVYLSEGRGE